MDAAAGVVAALLATFLWAWSGVRFMPIIKDHGPFVVITFKAATAAALFWVTCTALWLAGRVDFPAPTWILSLVLSGLFGLALGDYAYFASMRRAGVRHAALIYSASPLFLLAYEALAGHRMLATLPACGVVLIVLGVAVVTHDRTAGGASGGELLSGTLWALLAALGQAIGIVLQKEALDHTALLPAAAWRLTGGSAGLFVILFLRRRTGAFAATIRQRPFWSRALSPVFFGTFIGIAAMTLVVQKTTESIAGALLSLTPIFLLPVSYVMTREPIRPLAALGTAIAVLGVILLNF